MYTAYTLTDQSRQLLLDKFPPKYPKVIAHHVTVDGGVKKGTEAPLEADIRVIGEGDSGDGLQALVVSVNGSTRRPDGKVFHITWSLDPEMYKPVDSNAMLADGINKWKLKLPTQIDTVPEVLK